MDFDDSSEERQNQVKVCDNNKLLPHVKNIRDQDTKTDNPVMLRHVSADVCTENSPLDEIDLCDVISGIQSSSPLEKLPTFHEGHLRVSKTPSSEAVRHETPVNQQQHSSASCRKSLDVKSGHLMFITSDQGHKSHWPGSDVASLAGRGAPHHTRCPVIVKIHQKMCEKYAIISRTRRHPHQSSFFLKLKHCHVTQSPSNPSHFLVVSDSPVGRTFTFEASSPDVAKEWMEALSPDCQRSLPGSTHHRQPRKTTDLSNAAQNSNKTSHSLRSELKCSSPVLTIPNSLIMPVLSESQNENEEE